MKSINLSIYVILHYYYTFILNKMTLNIFNIFVLFCLQFILFQPKNDEKAKTAR